jgi:hypothetical protein
MEAYESLQFPPPQFAFIPAFPHRLTRLVSALPGQVQEPGRPSGRELRQAQP